MKYIIFTIVGVGLAATILALSLWRQGQASLYPQASLIAPSPVHNAQTRVIPPEFTDYYASYSPKILPLKPLYLPKMMWQRLVLAIPRSKESKQNLLLDRAEERMQIALYLWQHNSFQNADANFLKSQQYLLQATHLNIPEGHERLREIQVQHSKILESLEAPSELVREAVALNTAIQALIW